MSPMKFVVAKTLNAVMYDCSYIGQVESFMHDNVPSIRVVIHMSYAQSRTTSDQNLLSNVQCSSISHHPRIHA